MEVDITTWDDVEWLVEARANPAEGPVWDHDTEAVWWVDIMEGDLHRYEPGTRSDSIVAHLDVPLGAVGLWRDGHLVAATSRGLEEIDVSTGTSELLVAVEDAVAASRANDGKPGPDGAFWMGTMATDLSPGQGSLHRVGADGSVRTVVSPVSISNGLDWIDATTLYYVDSATQRIDLLEVDPVTSRLIRRTTVVEIAEADGLPDGLTLDAAGHIWVALYGGGEVRRYAPTGELIGRVCTPTRYPTSCTFGGANLDELYITAARVDERGGLLRCRVGIRGREPHRFSR